MRLAAALDSLLRAAVMVTAAFAVDVHAGGGRGLPEFDGAGDLTGSGRLPPGEWRLASVISPGNSPGCITGENIVLAPTSTLVIEIGGRAPCSEFDRFIVSNRLALNGATLELRLLNGFVPAAGDSFDVLDWGTLEGTFGAVTLAAANLPATLSWDTAALLQSGTLRVIAANTAPVATRTVPIPVWALTLGGLALAALGTRVARRPRAGDPRSNEGS